MIINLYPVAQCDTYYSYIGPLEKYLPRTPHPGPSDLNIGKPSSAPILFGRYILPHPPPTPGPPSPKIDPLHVVDSTSVSSPIEPTFGEVDSKIQFPICHIELSSRWSYIKSPLANLLINRNNLITLPATCKLPVFWGPQNVHKRPTILRYNYRTITTTIIIINWYEVVNRMSDAL